MSECAGFDGKRIERRGWSHSPSPSSVFARFFRRPAAKTRPSLNVRAATSLSLYGRIKNKARKPSHVCFFLIFGRSLSISTRTLACLHFFLFFFFDPVYRNCISMRPFRRKGAMRLARNLLMVFAASFRGYEKSSSCFQRTK